MSLSTYLVAGSLASVALISGYFTLKDRAKTARLEAAVAMIDVQRAQLDQAKRANDANIAAIAAIKADLARQADVAAKAQAAERKRAAALALKLKRIEDAPATHDGPIAPVLRTTLDGVRSHGDGDTSADGADADPSGAPADRPGEPALPAETPAS